ncbi:MAG TPA: hypothetical protein DD723_10420 [Candidatus Omnitrophica bacterium]|nr:MAG: hypothetical protein A2Z81_06100 [Omnitrophica WOR_2 bacterium GWA2_45_18]OGX19740.1 MAG: hypothetical protein A2Y04_04945 [Omnitrophica WOR_2 bacterium GWC2_45_7]HBR15930.1 hypothetical protein [Candidatus Omnitrophota bacterium]
MLKYFHNRRKKGQSTLEYAVLVVITLGALMSAQVYMKRGIQGRFKSSADDIGDQFSVNNQNAVTTSRTTAYTEDTFKKGVTKSRLINNEITTESTESEIADVDKEDWK